MQKSMYFWVGLGCSCFLCHSKEALCDFMSTELRGSGRKSVFYYVSCVRLRRDKFPIQYIEAHHFGKKKPMFTTRGEQKKVRGEKR